MTTLMIWMITEDMVNYGSVKTTVISLLVIISDVADGH